MDIAAEFGIREQDLEQIVIPSDLRAAKEPEQRILDELARQGYSEDARFAIKLALEEALTNAIKHGNRNDPRKHVTIRYRITPQRAIIAIRDEGRGFCPDNVPDPTADENLERPNGRGIMLMHAYMTRVRYNPAGNEVWLMRENTSAPPASREGP